MHCKHVENLTMLANMLNFFKNLHILYIAKFGPNTSLYGWLPLQLHHKIEKERKTLQPAWGGSLIPWHNGVTNGAESARVKIHPSRFCPIWREKIKSPIRPAGEEVPLDLTVHSDIFLVVVVFDLCRVWSSDNHKIREARKELSRAGEYLKNMFQEWQMVKIGGIASKLWHPMTWKMDTGSQNDENLNDFTNLLPKLESSSSHSSA
jgi:hypothetical protein